MILRTKTFFFFVFIAQSHAFCQEISPDSLIRNAESAFAIDPNQTIDFSHQAIAQTDDLSLRSECRGLFLIGAAYFTMGEYDSTRLYLNQFLQTDSLFLLYDLHPRTYSWLCHIEMQEDQWRVALDHALIGEKFATKIRDTIRMIDHKNYLGEIYRNFDPENHERPLKYQKEALALAEVYGDPSGMMYSYNFIGAIYEDMDSMSSALDYYSRTIEIAELIDDAFALGQAYHNVANVYKSLDIQDSVFAYNMKALPYVRGDADQVSYTEILAICHADIAKYYLGKGQIGMAQTYIDSAYTHVEESYNYRAEILRIKAQIADSRGNHKLAFDLFNQYDNLKDSLTSANNSRHINNLLEWYEHEKKEKEIAELLNINQQIEIENVVLNRDKERSEYQRTILFWICLSIILMSGGLFFWFRQKRKIQLAQQKINALELEKERNASKRLKEELNYKTSTLTSYSLALAKQNEVLEKVKKKLTLAGDNEMIKIVNEINLNQTFENEWVEFNNLFSQVHPAFKQKLKEIAPDLTSNDTRICVLLKLQMNSKQIAQVVGVEPRTVDMARSRIRKKFGLKTEDSLSDFINEL